MQALGNGTSSVGWNRVLTGLTPGALYYYQAVAANAHGVSFGEVLSFR